MSNTLIKQRMNNALFLITSLSLVVLDLRYFFTLLAIVLVFSRPLNKKTIINWAFAALSTILFYKFFYRYSNWIWAKNVVIDPSEIAPQLRAWYVQPRDGIELQIVYFSIVTFIFSYVFISKYKVKNQDFKNQLSGTSAKVLSCGIAILLINTIPCFPPLMAISPSYFKIVALFTSIFWVFIYLDFFSPKLANWAFGFSLVPVCFVAITQMSTPNYSYIFAPALKILQGFPLREIYFQYDLLLSLVSIPFLFLKLDPNVIQVFFQCSLLIFFWGLFSYSKKFFLNRLLAAPFIMLVVFIRIYAAYDDPTFVFQVTPLRLDLWLIPLVFASFYGLSHWSVGVCLSVLIMLHQNFGIIYSAAYFQVVLVIFLLDFSHKNEFGLAILTKIGKLLKIYWKRYRLSICLIVFGIFILNFFTGQFGGNDASKLYRQFGFGFDRIGKNSGVWPILFLVLYTFGLILSRRSSISKFYFEAALFIIFICVGNLIYFLGRSHESNLLWISGSTILVLFVNLDLFLLNGNDTLITQKSHPLAIAFNRTLSISLPALIFSIATYFYSGQSINILKQQFERVKSGKIFSFPDLKFPIDLIRESTDNSEKVMFMSRNDFYYYYYGNYTADSYFIPYPAWVFKLDLVKYIQGKIDDGFYVVCDDLCERDIIADLKFSKMKRVSNISVFNK